ncbi:MAG: rhamnogalacturonan acetylesterase [Asticcacaulis sp.]
MIPDHSPYVAAKGYGFISVPNGNERAFSVRVPEGDYRVTAVLGDAHAPSRTTLWAEDRRLVAAPVTLKAGEMRAVSFLVNVRNAFLNPAEQDATQSPHVGLRGDEAEGRTWDDQLTLSASGPQAALKSLTIAPVKVRRILLAGDSTVTDQAGADYASWGQMLPRFMGGDVVVANHARSGETLKSFLTSLRWDKLLTQVRPDDVVLIQFAHNDEKKQWPRTYAAADGAYPAYLAAFVADIRQRGAQPVLITPVARRFFDDEGKIENTHAGYDAAVREVAANLSVPLIDLTQQTTELYEALGPDRAGLAFADHGKEKTHHNAYGAFVIASYVAKALAGFGLGLEEAKDVPSADPAHPLDPLNYELTPADWPIMRAPQIVTQTPEVTPAK